MATHCTSVCNYHANNIRYVNNAFLTDIAKYSHTISFLGVNAHIQNGIAKKHLWDLQDTAWMLLLHAKTNRLAAITSNLWLYTICHANDCLNLACPKEKSQSCLELLSGSSVAPKFRDFHTNGCPCYMLDSCMQQGHKLLRGLYVPGFAFIWACCPSMLNQLPLCWTHPQSLSHPNFSLS